MAHKRKGGDAMKNNSETGRRDQRPPVVHMTEEDRADLQRFRELAEKMRPEEKRTVIRQMLEKADTP